MYRYSSSSLIEDVLKLFSIQSPLQRDVQVWLDLNAKNILPLAKLLSLGQVKSSDLHSGYFTFQGQCLGS